MKINKMYIDKSDTWNVWIEVIKDDGTIEKRNYPNVSKLGIHGLALHVFRVMDSIATGDRPQFYLSGDNPDDVNDAMPVLGVSVSDVKESK